MITEILTLRVRANGETTAVHSYVVGVATTRVLRVES